MKTSNSMLRVITCWCLCLSLCSFSIAEKPTKLTQDGDMYPASEELKSKAQVREDIPTVEAVASPIDRREALVTPVPVEATKQPLKVRGDLENRKALESSKYDRPVPESRLSGLELIDHSAELEKATENLKSRAVKIERAAVVDAPKEPIRRIPEMRLHMKDISDIKRNAAASAFGDMMPIVLTQEQIDERNNLKPGVPLNQRAPVNPDASHAFSFYIDDNGNAARNLVEIGLCTDYWSSESTYEILDEYGNSTGIQDASWVGNNSCGSAWWDLAAGNYILALYDSYGDAGLAAAVYDHQTATLVLDWFGGSPYDNAGGDFDAWDSYIAEGFAIGDGGCGDGYVYDCSGDGDCCPVSWIGDGLCDTNETYGCELTCFDNDGGDCETDDGGDCAGYYDYYSGQTYNCDYFTQMGYTCEQLENNYGYDCSGCESCDDGGDCAANSYGLTCDDVIYMGYTCEDIQGFIDAGWSYDCSGCNNCDDDGGSDCFDEYYGCGYYLNYGYTCDQLENNYGFDCSACDAEGACDDGGDDCSAIYDGGLTCDELANYGYTCEQIENNYGYDCSGCECPNDNGGGDDDCANLYGDYDCNYWTQYGYTCDQLEGYGYDCSGCESCDDGGGDTCDGMTVNMYDSYGDGWNGNELNIGGSVFGIYDYVDFATACYTGDNNVPVSCDGGSWQSEVYWEILDSAGTLLLSGGAPYSGFLGDACADAAYPDWVGDGYCDTSNNYEHCYDGGDCCESTCIDATYDCATYGGCNGECLDPNGNDDACGEEGCADSTCGYYLNYGYTCDQLEGYGFDCSACDAEGACGGDDGGDCAENVYGLSCDDVIDMGYTCEDIQGFIDAGWPYDCTGCDNCDDAGDDDCLVNEYGFNCNDLVNDYGYTCEELLAGWPQNYDCTNCEACEDGFATDDCGSTDCGYYLNYGYTCDELGYYGIDCSACEAQGGCDGGDDGGGETDPCEDVGGFPQYMGDGWCDSANNNEACGYDLGDCCPTDCEWNVANGCPENDDYPDCYAGPDVYDYCGTCETCEDPDSQDNQEGGACEGGGEDDECADSDYYYGDCNYYLDYGYTCEELENYYGFDCSGCDCEGDDGGSGDCAGYYDYYSGQTYNCDYWTNYGYTCEQLENNYGYDCSGCESCDGDEGCAEGYVEDCADADCCSETWIGDGLCDGVDQAWGCDLSCYDNDGGDCDEASDCASSDCGYYLNYGYTCEQLEGYGFDCSLCDAEGACGGDDGDCADTYYGYNCEDLLNYGYTCEQLENNYGYDCSGCDCGDDSTGGGDDGCADAPYPQWISDGYCDTSNNYEGCWDGGDCCESTCVDATYDCDTYGGCNGECLDPDGNDDACGEDSCADTSCGYYLNYGYTCDELVYYGFDCSACEAEGACGDDTTGGDDDCADHPYYYGDCNYYLDYGYTCEQLEEVYYFDCSGCDCGNTGADWDAEVTGLTAEGNADYGNGIAWDWDDLSDVVECDEGYVNDCADADCCSETWIGDGLCDGEDQAWGCDLSCYDNDGGDCADETTGGGESCADTSCGYYLNYGYTCDQLSNNYGYDCSVCEAEGACTEGATNEECAGTFEFYGADPAGGYGPCWDDGSGYFFFDWDGGCIASAVTYSTNGGEPGTLSLEGYGFNDGFFFYGFEPGDLVEASLTFTDVETDVLAAVSECVAECGDGNCTGEEDYYNCPEDCNEPGTCDEGYVLDCVDDDCCLESWIGDGYADCEDQAYGCDLTCYDNDGGDCDSSGGDACADTTCGYYLDYGYDCDYLTYYGIDCSACEAEGACGGDDTACADDDYYYGNCDYWTQYGYTCDQLESNYGFDCSGCESCDDGGDSACAEDCPEGTYWDGYSCYDCSYCLYTYDDSACESPEDCCGMCGGSADGDCGSRSATSAPSLSASNNDVNMKKYDKNIANFKAMSIGMAPNVLTPIKKSHVSDFNRPTMINIETGEIVQGSSNASRDVSYSVHVTCDNCLYGEPYDGYFNSTVSDIIITGGDYGTSGCGAVSAISTELGTTPESAAACAEWGVVEAECEFFDCEGQCAEGYENWVGDGYCDDGSWGFWFNCDEFDCDGGDCLDECGECNGDGSSCACEPGDVNDDGTSNVQDIVLIVGYILDGEADFDMGCADVNSDGTVNVQDIVVIVNGILEGRTTSDAREVKLNIEDGSVSFDADGFVGAVQMTLSHGVDFTIELTDKAMYAASSTNGNMTTLIVVAPESNELFEASDFVIKEAIFANEDSYATVAMPTELSLSKAYPNPFNPSTSFNVYVPAEGVVDLSVYNVMGQLVDVIHSGNMTQGSHNITWNAFDMTSGVYFVRAESINGASVQKVMLMK